MPAIKHLLAIPFLEPLGVEVKLFFEESEPECGTSITLRCADYHTVAPWGERLWLPLPGLPLWTPDHPHLHKLQMQLGYESHEMLIGLRRIEARGKKLFLNGEPFYVRGFGCDGDPRGGFPNR